MTNTNNPRIDDELREKISYGIDKGSPSGDYTAFSIRDGNKLFTFVGGEAEAIINLLNLKDIEHAKALQLAKIEAKIEELKLAYLNIGVSDDFYQPEINKAIKKRIDQLTKQKKEIENETTK